MPTWQGGTFKSTRGYCLQRTCACADNPLDYFHTEENLKAGGFLASDLWMFVRRAG